MNLANSVSRFFLSHPPFHRGLNIVLLCALFWLSSRFFIPFSNENLSFYQIIAGGVSIGYLTMSFQGVSGTESHRTQMTAIFICLLSLLSIVALCFPQV